MRRGLLWIVLAALLLAAFAVPCHASTYWVSDSLTRVRKDDATGSGTSITLYGGRREVVSCQLSIRPTSTAARTVTVTNAGGLTVAMFKEHHVLLTTGSAQSSYYYNHGGGAGWWPDGLLPIASGAAWTVTSGVNSTIWVDITIPAEATAGAKTVTITWSSATYTITVNVGNFTLPERPYMGSLFRFLNVEYDEDANALLREHRLLPMYNTVTDSRNQDWVSCSFYSSINRSTCAAVTAAPTSGAVATKKALYAPLPTGTTLYSYTFDEPGACADNAGLQATAADYYAALDANDVKMLVTMAPHDDWDYANMIPVVLPKLYVAEDVATWVAAGRTIWSYNCLNQDKYSPKWLLDMSPPNYRDFGFLNQAMDFSGILYWACDDWDADPWNDVELAKWGTTKPGEGMLVYPATGSPDGDLAGTVLPSMRLKYLRDASQDYDYVELCEDEGLSAEAAAIVATVGSSFTWGEWTTDGDVVIAAHDALWDLLDDPPTPPSAQFSGTPTSGDAPLTVAFSDLSVGATSWAWAFGDAGTSTSQNPSHEYAASGNYTVSLTATNAAGSDIETKVNYISVTAAVVAPVAAFSGTPTSGDEPLTVDFTDLSTNSPTSWLWDFGDSTTSTGQHPEHEYAGDGTYTVTLAATNSAGSDEEEKVDYITVSAVVTPPLEAPTAAFSVTDPPVGFEPIAVPFTNESTGEQVTYNWDFGDGTSSDEESPTHWYWRPGTHTYTVTLTASNGAGTDTAQHTVTVTARKRRIKDRFR